MDGAREQLLAGAGFAREQDGHAGVRDDSCRALERRMQRRAVAEDPFEAVLLPLRRSERRRQELDAECLRPFAQPGPEQFVVAGEGEVRRGTSANDGRRQPVIHDGADGSDGDATAHHLQQRGLDLFLLSGGGDETHRTHEAVKAGGFRDRDDPEAALAREQRPLRRERIREGEHGEEGHGGRK